MLTVSTFAAVTVPTVKTPPVLLSVKFNTSAAPRTALFTPTLSAGVFAPSALMRTVPPLDRLLIAAVPSTPEARITLETPLIPSRSSASSENAFETRSTSKFEKEALNADVPSAAAAWLFVMMMVSVAADVQSFDVAVDGNCTSAHCTCQIQRQC